MKPLLRLLVLLAFLAGLPAWLLGSASGLWWTVALTERYSGGRVVVDGAQGRLGGPLAVEEILVIGRNVRVRIQQVQMDWSPWRAPFAGLHVRQISAAAVDIRLLPRTAPPEKRRPFELAAPFPMTVDQLQIADLRIHLAQGSSLVFPAVKLSDAAWKGVQLRVDRLSTAPAASGPLELRADVVAALDQLVIRDAELSGPGRLRAAGRLSFSEVERSDLQLSWEDLRWPLRGAARWRSARGSAGIEGAPQSLRVKAQAQFGAQGQVHLAARREAGQIQAEFGWTQLAYLGTAAEPLWHSPEGRLQLDGTAESFAWTTTARLHARNAEGRLDAAGRGNRNMIEVQQSNFAGLGGTVRAKGQVQWSPQLTADAQAELAGLNPGALWPEWVGAVNGLARVQTEKKDGAARIRFDFALKDSVLRGYPLRLAATGEYARPQLDLAKFEIDSGATRLVARGRASPPYAFSAQLDSPRLEELWAGLSGEAQLRLDVAGPRTAPQLRLQGSASQLAYGPYRARSARVDADLHPTRPSRLDFDMQVMSTGRWLDRVRIAAAGTAREHRIELSATGAEGEGGATVQGRLDLAAPAWQGRLVKAQLTPHRLDGWELERAVPLAVSRTQLSVDETCLRSVTGRACLALHRRGAEFSAAAQMERVLLRYFRPWLPGDWQTEGEISGVLDLALSGTEITRLTTDLTTTAGRIRAGGNAVLDFLPSRVYLRPDAGGLRAGLDLRLAQGSALGELRFQPGGGLLRQRFAGGLELDLPDLSFLTLASPELAGASGRLSGDFALAGTLSEPLLDGELQVSEGKLTLATPGIELSGLAVDFTTERGGLTRVSAGADSGGGRLEVKGGIAAFAAPFKAQLTFKGRDFQLTDTRAARIWISPDLKLDIKGRRAQLGGEILVPRAALTPREIELGISPSNDQVIVGSAQRSEPLLIHSDVRLRLGDDVRFEGFGLKAKLGGDIRTLDEPGRPTTARGQLVLESGRYRAYGQDLEIETGRLLFTGGPVREPGLELRAQRKLETAAELAQGEVTVGVRVRGTLDKPEFSLFSQPAMPQDQQLSWLVLGRPLEENVAGQDRERLSGAALSLGLTGGEFIAKRVGRGLGLDEISVGARPGETSEQARLTIGKYLSPKLFVSYGFGLFQPARYFRLLYDIGRGFKLSTETGLNTGGDLLYTIER